MMRRLLLILALLLAAPAVAQEEDPFGSLEGHLFALRGTLFSIPPRSRDVSAMEGQPPLGTVYATRLAVEPREFSSGFPGISERYEWFGVDYAGWLRIDQAGRYRFRLTSDDGSRLYVDGALVVDNDGVHGPRALIGWSDLSPGLHRIRVQYFQGPRYEVALMLERATETGEFDYVDTDRMGPGRIVRDGNATTVSMPDHALFENGRLTRESREVLTEIYRALIAPHPRSTVVLTASAAHAPVVAEALQSMGLAPARLKIRSGGAGVELKVTPGRTS